MSKPSPWNEQTADFLLKALPVLFGSGLGGVITLLNTTDLPKIALGAGVGGAGTLGYALVAPSLKKVRKGADSLGESGAEAGARAVERAIAGATGAEAKYLEAQRLACRTDRCQGMGRSFVPLLDEIYVSLSIGSDAVLPRLGRGSQLARAAGQLAHSTKSWPSLDIWTLIRRAESGPEGQQYCHLAILAWGGLGKTTLLKHLAYIYSSERYPEKQVSARIPIFISLAECWRKYLSKQAEEHPNLPSLAKVIREYHVPKLPDTKDLKLPSNWSETLLKKGRAIILLDGFDEVPQDKRPLISQWIDWNIHEHRKNIFIVSSRPKAYQEEAKADHIALSTIWVERFNADQQKKFIHKWYLCREINANSGRQDADVLQIAKESAEELLAQIQTRPEIEDLAKVPLLLNMIASFHRDNPQAKLPRRRVDLYQGICNLQLKDRPGAKDLETKFLETDAQKILQNLALAMLINNRQRDIERSRLIDKLDYYLKVENEILGVREFLEDVVRISELLIEKDADSYEFSHWSFQEYLAAREIWQEQKESLLYEKFSEKEWWPTIELYASITKNPSGLIQAMLEHNANDLAYRCFQETTKQITPALEQELKALKSAVQASRYTKLAEQLRKKQWGAADEETYRLMIITVGKEEGQQFESEDFLNFPCEDLRQIDHLWVQHSEGKFGFSVQKKIWEECGSPSSYHEDWKRFGELVSWRKNEIWLSYSDLTFNRTGEIPHRVFRSNFRRMPVGAAVFYRAKTCKL